MKKCNTIFLFHIDFNHCDWRSILPERSMWYAGSLLKELHVGVATEKPTSTSCSNNADSTKGISCLWSEASIAGNYSGWGSVCDCAWPFCRWDAWQPGFPPSYERTPNQRPSIAEQLVLYSVTIKTNIFGHDCKSAHVWLFLFQMSKDSVHVTKYE